MLLDENLPKPLKNHFSDKVEVLTVPEMGWASKKNGELISLMVQEGIEYLITVDKNLEYQQNLSKYSIRLIVLLTYSNRYKDLKNKVEIIENHISQMKEDQKLRHIDLRN